MTAFYAIKYPQHLKRYVRARESNESCSVLLLSPFGLVGMNKNDKTIQERVSELGCCRRCMFKCLIYLWKKKVTPFSLLRMMGRCCAARFIKRYMRRRMVGVP